MLHKTRKYKLPCQVMIPCKKCNLCKKTKKLYFESQTAIVFAQLLMSEKILGKITWMLQSCRLDKQKLFVDFCFCYWQTATVWLSVPGCATQC